MYTAYPGTDLTTHHCIHLHTLQISSKQKTLDRLGQCHQTLNGVFNLLSWGK